MNKKRFISAVLAFWALAGIESLQAQDSPAAGGSYTLDQCVEYALANSEKLKNASFDIQSADAKVKEIRAIGLPQVNFQFDVRNNYLIQPIIVDARTAWAFSGGPTGGTPPPAADAPPQALRLGIPNSGSAMFSLSQLLFDGSYFLGLKAATTFTEVSKLSLTQSKTELVEKVSKAYYSLLVAQERFKLLDENIARIDTLLRHTVEMNKNGFVEEMDVKRLKVTFNNLQSEKIKIQRMVDLSKYLLRFQMCKPDSEGDFTVVGNLKDIAWEAPAMNGSDNAIQKRIEIKMLDVQTELKRLDLKNNKVGYYPKAFLTGTYGLNAGSKNLGFLTHPNGDYWFGSGTVGISIRVNLFDGFMKKYQIQQAKFEVEKSLNQRKETEKAIGFQNAQAQIALSNASETLKAQKENIDLAQDISKISAVKYKEGVGSNLEVITAETSLKEAQTNYYAALYDALIAKIDYLKAQGELFSE